MLNLFGKKKSKGLRCPYCMAPLDYKKLHSYCFKCDKMVKPVKGRCPDCNSVTHEVCYWEEKDGRTCGCGRVLPPNFENSQNVLIALVGPKQAGKSEYISVLFSYLRKNISGEFRISITAADDNTAKKLNNDLQTNYAGQVVAVTDSIRAGGTAGEPYVMSIRTMKDFVTLVLYDTAGEDLKELEVMRQEKVYDYITQADGIMFFADPLQFNKIRDNVRIDKSLLPVQDASHDNHDVFDRVMAVLADSVGRKGRVDTNLAFVITKGDVLMIDDPEPCEELLAIRSSDVPCIPRKLGVVDQDNLSDVSNFMKSYISEISDSDLTEAVDINFSNYRMFLVSSLGHNPDGATLAVDPVPFRIEDPLLWLISQSSSVLEKR